MIRVRVVYRAATFTIVNSHSAISDLDLQGGQLTALAVLVNRVRSSSDKVTIDYHSVVVLPFGIVLRPGPSVSMSE